MDATTKFLKSVKENTDENRCDRKTRKPEQIFGGTGMAFKLADKTKKTPTAPKPRKERKSKVASKSILGDSGCDIGIERGDIAVEQENAKNQQKKANLNSFPDLPDDFMIKKLNQEQKRIYESEKHSVLEEATEEVFSDKPDENKSYKLKTVEKHTQKPEKEIKEKNSNVIDSIEFKKGFNTISINLIKKSNRMYTIKVLLNESIEIRPTTYQGSSAANTFWQLLTGALKK